MKAMIFAAGRGQRMRPLTDTVPKPLLEVGGKPLIVWHLERLAAAGVREVVINTAHLAGQFPAALGDGRHWGLHIRYSEEGARALETGGGTLHALPLLGDSPFILVSGDIWCDFDFSMLPQEPTGPAHLLLVDNPPHHPEGDFVLGDQGRLSSALASDASGSSLTFSGIALCCPALLDNWQQIVGDSEGADEEPPRFRLAPLLHAAARAGRLSGQQYSGQWTDVGTPERLAQLDSHLARQNPM